MGQRPSTVQSGTELAEEPEKRSSSTTCLFGFVALIIIGLLITIVVMLERNHSHALTYGYGKKNGGTTTVVHRGSTQAGGGGDAKPTNKVLNI